jgi:hypothetical protein
MCMVKEVALGVKSIISYADSLKAATAPLTFWEVLHKWLRMWMWENLQWVGDDDWIAEATADGSLIAVTDGSYMKDLYPNIHSAALVLECSKGRGRLWCSFPVVSQVACSYRDELVGLMAIHLILLAINKINPDLAGLVHTFSDCLGMLNKDKDLPPSRVPLTCAHSDVLKNILVNCSKLLFEHYYLRVLVKEYAQAEGVSARFGVDSESALDLSCGIGVSETAECWEKVQCTSARHHVDLVLVGNETGMHLACADT